MTDFDLFQKVLNDLEWARTMLNIANDDRDGDLLDNTIKEVRERLDNMED